MGTANVGNNQTPNTQNNPQNIGINQTSTPGVFNGASSVNFLGQTNSAPAIVSNANVQGKINQANTKFTNLSQPYTPKPQTPIDENSPFTQDSTGQKKYYNQATGQYDITSPTEYENPEATGALTDNTAGMQSYYTPESQQALAGFDSLQKNNDSITSQYLQYIKDSYKQMQEDQKIANSQAQNNALLALGVQGGSGSPTDRNSYVQSIIDQGQTKLRKLQLDEQGAYLDALKAKQEGDLRLYTQKVDQLDAIRNAKIEEAKSFNEKVQAQAEKIKEENRQTEQENAVAEIVSKGETDPAKVMAALKSKGMSVPAKKVTDTIALVTGIGGTGVIGEYNFYKAQAIAAGQTPVDFNTYQNQDANRKAQITNGAGLTTQQNQSFLKITDKFQADELIKNALKGQTAVSIADQVIANPSSATNQLKALYSLVKNLDPDSAVREGEISLAEKAQSYFQTWNTALTRVSQGQIISPETAVQLAQATKDLASSWNDTARTRQKQYEAQAAGAGIKDAFQQYLKGSELPFQTGTKLIKNEQDAQSAVTSYLQTATPEQKTQFYNNTKQIENILGRPASFQDYIQAFPEDFPNYQANSGPGVVGGVDITTYATDPKHEQKIASIFDRAPDSSNVLDFDTYIKSIAPQSPITGDMILTASSTYGVDPRLITAIIQNDSSFGTKGKATYTMNPGNVGNDDEGNIKKFKNWNEGVLAVAQWLARHKIA